MISSARSSVYGSTVFLYSSKPVVARRTNASFSMLDTTAPTAINRRVERARAAPLATKPRSCAARITAARLSARTPADPFSTRETVAVETPARRATSRATGLRGDDPNGSLITSSTRLTLPADGL